MSIREKIIADCDWAIHLIDKGDCTAVSQTRSFYSCLIKELAPRVITWEELERGDFDFGVQEFRYKGETEKELYPVVLYKAEAWGPYFNKDENFLALCEKGEYMVSTRVWTSRPTEEQRNVVPWKGV